MIGASDFGNFATSRVFLSEVISNDIAANFLLLVGRHLSNILDTLRAAMPDVVSKLSNDSALSKPEASSRALSVVRLQIHIFLCLR